MPTCFVMQPFDADTFDKRYMEIFKPAILDASLEPYRVDQDPTASIPIQEIESGIRDSRVCLAEITLDNPNVWFELGFAIACGKQVVLICSDERQTRFPFDVHHRSIIRYTTKSVSDFEILRNQITEKLLAYVEKAENLITVAEISKLSKIEGLEQHEVVALTALAESIDSPTDHASAYMIRQDMESGGFTRLATTLAIKTLLKKDFITEGRYSTFHNDDYIGYSLTEVGWAWILENKERLLLRKSQADEGTDDIPF